MDQRDGHDAIVSELGLEAIHLIKCDVEGHELDVLHGARQVLERDRPSLLVESVDDRPAPGQTARVFGFLRELGYRGYYFAAGGETPIDRFEPARDQADAATSWHTNFGFVPEERIMPRRPAATR